MENPKKAPKKESENYEPMPNNIWLCIIKLLFF